MTTPNSTTNAKSQPINLPAKTGEKVTRATHCQEEEERAERRAEIMAHRRTI